MDTIPRDLNEDSRNSAQQRARAKAQTFQLRRRARFLGVSAHQQEYTRKNSDAEIAHAQPASMLMIHSEPLSYQRQSESQFYVCHRLPFPFTASGVSTTPLSLGCQSCIVCSLIRGAACPRPPHSCSYWWTVHRSDNVALRLHLYTFCGLTRRLGNVPT